MSHYPTQLLTLIRKVRRLRLEGHTYCDSQSFDPHIVIKRCDPAQKRGERV